MSTIASWRQGTAQDGGHETGGWQRAPGKQTLSEALPVQQVVQQPVQQAVQQQVQHRAAPAGGAVQRRASADVDAGGSGVDPFGLHVQRKAGGGAADGAAPIHAAAQAGVAGGGGALPFLDQIQMSFGSHDVSGVSAHVGGAASEACATMGAQAYATGNQVAFGGAPDLHTAAHEAAHVVQQRAGVHLLGGVGKAGDVYEQHADEVADLVVQGKSAQQALDRHAGGGGGGGGGGALQRRLVVGGKEIDPDTVDVELAQAFKLGIITQEEALSMKRLEGEARDKKETYDYADWKDAAVGVRQHDVSKLGSLSLQRGSITFTNVVKKYHGRATELLELLAAHPSISGFINNRPCFISLVSSPDNPASVIDVGKQVNIELAYWYFETYSLGYLLGMLCHEFAVHPMADVDPMVGMLEPGLMGQDLPTGIKDGKKDHTINTAKAGQVDHIFASIIGMPRNKVYVNTVLEMATLLVQEAGKKGSTISPHEVTGLLDCFMMDCASILATNDHRDKGALVPGLIATAYNDYLAMLQQVVTDKGVLALLPKAKSSWGVAKDYFGLVGSLIKGQVGNHSRDREHYQPTDLQMQAMEARGRRLHWIEPDGRCVFGSLGHLAGLSAHAAIRQVLEMLNGGSAGLTQIITDAGLAVEDVIECIRKGRWNQEHVGDVILEVAATALGLGVTVLMPNGTTFDVNGGGELIVRVTSPLEHYHSVNRN